jgi:hypothetical protein
MGQFSKLSLAYPSKNEGSMDVSQWMLTCSACGNDFLQSSIPENLSFVELHLPPKPEFPPGGLTRDCPHCGKSATYERHDLRYRGTGPTD